MRLAGAGAVVLSGILLGLRAAASLRQRAAELEQLRHMVSLMELEIVRFQTPLPTLFREFSERLSGNAGLLCGNMSRALENGEELRSAWYRETEALHPEERRALAELGDCLGRYGRAELEPVLRNTEQELSGLAEDARALCRDKGRVYLGICAAGGFLLAILLA